MDRARRDRMAAWAFYIGAIVLVFAIALGFGRGVGAIACVDIESQTKYETKFSIFSGCYVHVDGRWVPRESWRGEQE